jgi:hypothetical protein
MPRAAENQTLILLKSRMANIAKILFSGVAKAKL